MHMSALLSCPMNRYLPGRTEAKFHPITSHLQNGHGNIVPDEDCLSMLATQNQHSFPSLNLAVEPGLLWRALSYSCLREDIELGLRLSFLPYFVQADELVVSQKPGEQEAGDRPSSI